MNRGEADGCGPRGAGFDGADLELEALAASLVDSAYAPQAQSTPERDDENVEPGHLADPLEPRKGHRPKPTEPLPVEAPPVPKLRPLE
ncbi:hypothetical protein [Tahibacter caeni]|uniref:hypothetical protein n=1 Tax=Tahibacter caeni TaxID=1453545 RepID=UPI002147D2FE|nr:hypothetical protein [Tahibacter caeni]